MYSDANGRRQAVFKLLTLFLVSLIIGLLVLAYTKTRHSAPETLGDVAAGVAARDKEDLQAFLRRQTGGIHDTVPDGDIGRILQARVSKPFGGVSVTSNNAGMRDDRDYGAKHEGVYRVIVLGDSFAFGHEGLKQDRYGEQLEALLQRHALTAAGAAAGKRIEVLNVAQGSWTTVNETAYMVSRFTAYQPDLVILLMVSNDLDDTQGVRGIGTSTNSFSPEYRDKGSSFFSVYNPARLGFRAPSLLYSDLSPESSRRWRKAFDGIKRLESTLDAAGGKLLISAFDEYRDAPPRNPQSLWRDLIIHYHAQTGLRSPLLFVNPYLEKDTSVGVHPNRKGHGFLAIHYLHALKALGWIDVAHADALPAPHEDMDMRIAHTPDSARIAAAKAVWTTRFTRGEIDFRKLDKLVARAIYGGLFKHRDGPVAGRLLMFLLKRTPSGKHIEIELDVPRHPELYPFKLELRINGVAADELNLAGHAEGGVHRLRAPLPDGIAAGEPLEVALFTRSYWAELEDARMFSYFPLRARIAD